MCNKATFAFLLICWFLLGTPELGYAQNKVYKFDEVETDTVKTEEELNLDPNNEFSDATVNLAEEEEEEAVEAKKKKRKKNEFYGLKTRKGFTKKGFGDREVITLFHYLKEYKDPNPYIRDVYWYDTESGQIKVSSNIKKEHARILHGPYKRILGDQVIEEGIFYIGTKHGRWTEFNSNDILLSKEKYIKGWPKESTITYYDPERKHIKEVIPVEYGEEEGTYYYFHNNGQVAVIGEYEYGEKVGVWKEYYKNKARRKKEIQYKKDPFQKGFKPYILREWDENGKLIYTHSETTAQK